MIAHLLVFAAGIIIGLFVGCLVVATRDKRDRTRRAFRERMERAFPNVRDRGDRE